MYSNFQKPPYYLEISSTTNCEENTLKSDSESSLDDQIHQIYRFNTSIDSQIQYFKIENDSHIFDFSNSIWQPPQNC